MAKIVVVTSGKGGVGKTTTSASFATGLALRGHKTVVIDFDVGLRNLDLIMGCERRVVYDFVNVINNEARLQQALIRDKEIENLYILPASQTRDKDALSDEGVARVIDELAQEFDYIICDSPAGIERGAILAMYHADEAIIAIPQNRTLVAQKLTVDAPIKPELVEGITSIEKAFEHFKPEVKVNFETVDGATKVEALNFKNLESSIVFLNLSISSSHSNLNS